MKGYKTIINRIGYYIGYINGFIDGYLHGLKLDIVIFWWQLKHGFPSKEKMKTNPELRQSLAAVIFKDTDSPTLGAIITMANLLSYIHVIVGNGAEYMDGPTAIIGSMLFNPSHPDHTLVEICQLLDPKVELRERVIHLFNMVDKHNGWTSGTLHSKLTFFSNKPEYRELLDYFERFGLPANIDWLK